MPPSRRDWLMAHSSQLRMGRTPCLKPPIPEPLLISQERHLLVHMLSHRKAWEGRRFSTVFYCGASNYLLIAGRGHKVALEYFERSEEAIGKEGFDECLEEWAYDAVISRDHFKSSLAACCVELEECVSGFEDLSQQLERVLAACSDQIQQEAKEDADLNDDEDDDDDGPLYLLRVKRLLESL